MESFVAQHDTVEAIKKEFPIICVTTKVENEGEEQQHSNYVETIETNLDVKSEEVDIKLEEMDYKSINSIKDEYLSSEIEGESNAIDNLKQESTSIDEHQFSLKKEAKDIKGGQTALTSISVPVLASNLEGEHTLFHQNTLENRTSTFETSPHGSKYTPSQGKWKASKEKSCKALFKCEQCSYECNRSSRFRSHMRIHKDPSEVDMYECSQCDFKTKHKNNLKDHSIVHIDAADILMYKCDYCDFESKRKSVITKHIRKCHKSSLLKTQGKEPEKKTNSEEVLTCEHCFYECQHPSRLNSHMLIHEDLSELNLYECTQCNFKTKCRTSLKAHCVMHKETTKMPKYKCISCDFECKRKGDLIRHMQRRHKSSMKNQEKEPENETNSEEALSTCEHCSYESKDPSRLHSHMLTHKDLSQLNMYECMQCEFKTKYRNSIKAHCIIHKHITGMLKYKCNSCDFETKTKYSLRKHIIANHQKGSGLYKYLLF